jgi:hypothetical protein
MSHDDNAPDEDDEGLDDHADDLAARVLSAARRPVDWNRLTADDGPLVWAALETWVRWLVARYGLDHRDVPPCWFRHGALVEELSALRSAHLEAFHPAKSPAGPAEWHTTFGNARTRMRDWAARTGCKTGLHRDDVPAPWAHEGDDAYVDELRGFVALDRAHREAAQREPLE